MLLRILAIVHRNERHLPQRRAELYETATITLLRDWQLERGAKGAVIDEAQAMSLLGPVAFWMHENRASAHVEKGQVLRLMAGILATERGLNPEGPPAEVKQQVANFLDTVRQHSGLFVERGEGLYGFMHLTFEEYFTARQMISDPARVQHEILKRLHQPRWREPILLAVGLFSKTFFQGTTELLRAILDAASDYEAVLHRDLLFSVACVGDSANVSHLLRREIAGQLLELQSDRHGAGRYRALQAQIKRALAILYNDDGDEAVETALAQAIVGARDRTRLKAGLDIAEWLAGRQPVLAEALERVDDPFLWPWSRRLARRVRVRASEADADRWSAYIDDTAVARLLGALVVGGWLAVLKRIFWSQPEEPLSRMPRASGQPSGQEETATERVRRMIEPFDTIRTLELGEELLRALDGPDDIEARAKVDSAARNLWLQAPVDSTIEQVAWQCRLWEDEPRRAPGWRGDAVVLLRTELAGLRSALHGFDPPAGLQAAGQALFQEAADGYTLVPTVTSVAARSASLDPWPGFNAFYRVVDVAAKDLQRAVLSSLQVTSDPQHYYEACRLLSLSPSLPETTSQELRTLIRQDLDGENDERRLWVLQLLTEPGVLEVIGLDDVQRARLLTLLDGPTEQAALVLEVLFTHQLDEALLSRCWMILQHSEHALAGTVLGNLGSITEVRGDARLLGELHRGLGDRRLRRHATELLRKVRWSGRDTFVRAVSWLSSEDADVRHLAALLLADQSDLASIPRSVFAEVIRRRSQDGTPSGEGWALLRHDRRVPRLLRGLWLHGWADTLTQIMVGKPSSSYLYPVATYPDTRDVIDELLQQADQGGALITPLQEAARNLADLDPREDDEEPNVEALRQVATWLSQQCVSSLKTAGFAESATLRQILQEGQTTETARWIHDVLARRWLSPSSELGALSLLLEADEPELQVAGALALLAADLPTTLARILVDAAISTDDRVRNAAYARLITLCHREVYDGDDGALVEWLHQRLLNAHGYEATMLADAVGELIYATPYWPLRWLGTLASTGEDDPARRLAESALSYLNTTTPEVRHAIGQVLTDPGTLEAVAEGAASALNAALRYSPEAAEDRVLRRSLMSALAHATPLVTGFAADLLSWTTGPESWEAVNALLQTARDTTDDGIQARALTALCPILVQLRQKSAVDTTSEALFEWLGLHEGRIPLVEAIPALGNTENGAEALSLLQAAPASLVTKFSWDQSLEGHWTEILQNAADEWRVRQQWREIASQLPGLASELNAFLEAPDPVVRQAAAGAIATLHEDEDGVHVLGSLLAEESAVLDALRAAALHAEAIRPENFVLDNLPLVMQFVTWIVSRPIERMGQLIDGFLDELEDMVEHVGEGPNSNRWLLAAVLASISEQLTLKAFCRRRAEDEVVDLFARLARDPYIFANRVFALRALGNFQHFTEAVSESVFEACCDVDPVYQESRLSISKFKKFSPGSLERLTRGVQNASITLAYNAALLLGELGLRRSEELGREGRKRVADQLVMLLEQPFADRTVYVFSNSGEAEVVGSLYDVIFETMLRVVSGPDAPTTPTIETTGLRVAAGQ